MSGGKRKGAGRPKGKPTQKTLEKRAVQEAFNQRVMAKADALFNAQLSLALGSQKVFRVDEEEVDGKVKRVHTLVTEEDEIKALLDEHDGAAGVVDGVFYYFTTVRPDNKAIEAMLNRALGKAAEHKTVTFNVAEEARAVYQRILSELKLPAAKARRIVMSEFPGVSEAELISQEAM